MSHVESYRRKKMINILKKAWDAFLHPSGILSGMAIEKAVSKGAIRIDPFSPDRINPASYDVTLGPEVAVYEAVVQGGFRDALSPFGASRDQICGSGLRPIVPSRDAGPNCLDAARENKILKHVLGPGEPILLKPGIGYLMHTRERIWSERYVPVLDGKSSIGRLFAVVHVTAGYGDPGFDGQYTLEVTVTHPLILYEGMRVGQMRFHTMLGRPRPYSRHRSNYLGEAAMGPVPSKSWVQLMRDGIGQARPDKREDAVGRVIGDP